MASTAHWHVIRAFVCTSVVLAVLVLAPERTRAAPPTLSLAAPLVSGYSGKFDGNVVPGSPGGRIERVHWKWGDGTTEDTLFPFFPAPHAYPSAGTYVVIAKAFQNDGTSTTREVTVVVAPLPTRATAPLLARDASVVRIQAATLSYSGVPPLNDPRVRLALQHASAATEVTWLPTDTKEDMQVQPFDPTRADLLLRAAGAQHFRLELLVENGAVFPAVARALRADWEAFAGIEVTIVVASPAEYTSRLASGPFQVALGSNTDLAAATHASFEVLSATMVNPTRARVTASYQLNGANNGTWTARVHCVGLCRDAASKKTGQASGEGGLIDENGGPLTGAAGTITFEFTASIVSNDPSLSYPVTCQALTIATVHHGPGPDMFETTQPLPALTTWPSGVTVIHCLDACLAGR